MLALGSRISDVNVLAYLAAFGGGVISFLSPCVLPLVPGYLAMVTGIEMSALQDRAPVHTRRIVGTTALFIAGFGSVFVLLGLTAAGIGQPLRDHQEMLTRISGTIMFAMALFLLG
jgi:cytochrome c-type biogenesis protein